MELKNLTIFIRYLKKYLNQLRNNNLSRTGNANGSNLGGFTAGEADILRRAMGKKES